MDTRPGERLAAPGYGLPDSLGRGVDPAQVVDVAAEWEPRALDVDPEMLVHVIVQDADVHATAPSSGGES